MYKVLVRFRDLQDKGHVYNVGDIFPRSGLEVANSRVEELSSIHNRRGVALIARVAPTEASPVAKEATEEVNAGVSPAEPTKPNGRPRKRREKHVRADT